MRNCKVGFLFLCLTVVGFLFLASSSFGQGKPIELTYSNQFPVTDRQAVIAQAWAKEIEKRTNGRVKITVFLGGTLTQPDKIYDGVVRGLSDIGMSVLAYSRGRFPLTEVMDLPLGAVSGVVATKVINEYYNKFKPKEFDDVKILYLYGCSPGIMHTKKPVYKLEDFKGMRIRCTGLTAKEVAALGGIPVAMPQTEGYDAIRTGVADGVTSPYEVLKAYRYADVTNYTTENFGSAWSTGFFVAMNKEKWNSLPPDIQKIIEQVSRDWIEITGKGWDESDVEGKEFALKVGHKIIKLSKEEDARWARAVKPLQAEYVTRMKAKGLPGEEALNFYLDRLKALQ